MKKKWLRIAAIVTALFIALVLGAFAVMKFYLSQIERTYSEQVSAIAPEDEFFEPDTPDSDQMGMDAETQEPGTGPAEESVPPEDVAWAVDGDLADDHLINILLIGQDRYPYETDQKRHRSDTMILCSINPETGKVALISFLRDMYVQIPGGYSDNRLNTPYLFGGFPLLNETLEKNFGISVDANFSVDMTGFVALVDMIGGIDITLSEKEAEYYGTIRGEEIPPGLNHFDGQHTMGYALLRKLDSDFARTNRQREVLLAIFDKVKTLPLGDLLALLREALGYVTTDLTDGQILSLAYRLLPLISSLEIETYAVPARGTYQNANVRGMAVLLPDLEKIRTLLEQEYLPLH